MFNLNLSAFWTQSLSSVPWWVVTLDPWTKHVSQGFRAIYQLSYTTEVRVDALPGHLAFWRSFDRDLVQIRLTFLPSLGLTALDTGQHGIYEVRKFILVTPNRFCIIFQELPCRVEVILSVVYRDTMCGLVPRQTRLAEQNIGDIFTSSQVRNRKKIGQCPVNSRGGKLIKVTICCKVGKPE